MFLTFMLHINTSREPTKRVLITSVWT